MPTTKQQTRLFLLFALEGVAALAALFLIPSEGGVPSPARLALMAIPLALALGWTAAALRYKGDLKRYAQPDVILLFAFLSLALGLALFLLRYLDPERFLSAYQRLSPVLGYLVALSLQTALYLLYRYGGFHPERLVFRKPVYLYTAIAFGLLFLVFLFVARTRLGITFDPAYWGEPGVPLMGWQFALALLGGLGMVVVGVLARQRSLDLALPVLIYGLMLVVCLSVPLGVLKNSFYMPISSPAHVPYPYADSAYYDQMAQSLLIGHPYQGVIPTRPLYVLFLAILHILFDQNYARILTGQTIVLALLPVLLYVLGKKLHSRTAGLIVALFFIFREWTSLLISSQTRVTNTKMLLVDLPTLFLLLLACLFVFRWLERKEVVSAFAAGGMFGVLLLLRTQSLFIFPFIVLAALLVLGWRTLSFYRDALVFVLGVFISVFPWLLHNYRLTGEFAFEAAFENRLIISQYLFGGNAAIQNLNIEGMSLPRILVEFALRDPRHVFGFITNHFLATQVNGLMALPIIQPYNGLFAPINLYWMEWFGDLAWYNVVLLLIYLVVIAVGLGAAWKRWRWLGLLPVAFSVGYALATAASRFSSWRYDYPADWIAYFYFGVGVAELLGQAAVLFGAREEKVFASEAERMHRPGKAPFVRLPLLALLFALIGASPWLITNIASPRYADQSVASLESKISSLPGAPASQEISAFASQSDSFFQAGRLLYPRFFRAGSGLSSANPSPAFTIRDYPRLGFLLLNQTSTPAVFATRKPPAFAPQAADVIVLGCRQGDHVEVRLLAFPSSNVLYLSAPLEAPCSE